MSLIEFFVADIMLRLVDRAIQLHGALEVTSDTVLAFYYVHRRGARIYDPGPDRSTRSPSRSCLRRGT